MSGTGLAAQQNPYLISGGLGGLGLIAIGCTIWISADLQDEWRRLDSLEERLHELTSTRNQSDAAAADTTTDASPGPSTTPMDGQTARQNGRAVPASTRVVSR